MKKPHLLVWSDPPVNSDGSECQTGHGKIVKNILPILSKSFHLVLIGHGVAGAELSDRQYIYDIDNESKMIIVNLANISNQDYFGLKTFDEIMKTSKEGEKPECVLTVTDFKNFGGIVIHEFAELIKKYNVSWTTWIAMDDHELRPEYINPFLEIEKILCMCEYGKMITLDKLPILKNRCDYFYPNIDTSIFKPCSPEDREQLRSHLGWTDKKVMLFVGKNQWRKNITFTFDVMRKLPKEYLLYGNILSVLESIQTRRLRGFNLEALHKSWYRDVYHKICINDGNYLATHGIDDALLANLYQAADVYVLPSRTEGLGYTVLEAMACGCPVVASGFGPLTELLDGGNRGALIKTRNLDFGEGPVIRVRIQPDLDDFKDKIMSVCEDEKVREKYISNGFDFIHNIINNDQRINMINEHILSTLSHKKSDSLSPDLIL